ncbi:OLC1v1029004C1 [Oldenlandia corymbosa var. corymbosa]|uniref:Eukaryotic translation initiation factor 3 subunit L n=1 Tax=Oldenlandia corymbosa var. corymbosa TaxID=529605 RepID=A0AAV1CEQ9_OLDCO|nr:OLC1v1029004C1 [Oldenlandia corymbosa var. corymbosa]
MATSSYEYGEGQQQHPGQDSLSSYDPNYVPDSVRSFVVHLYRHIREKNVYEIHQMYENSFQSLSERMFKDVPWPSVDAVAPHVDNDHVFCLLYREMWFRHLYARLTPTLKQRIDSWDNYCNLFQVVLHGVVNMQLPNQWLWDMVDEFVYQFQNFCQYRAKMKNKTEQEIALLRQFDQAWNVYGVLNFLEALVEKSMVHEILEREKEGLEQFTATDGYDYNGGSNVLKVLGYFSMIGLLRVHCLLGDYQTGLKCLKPIDISQQGVYTSVIGSHIAIIYHYGFANLMLRRYVDAIREFNKILLYIYKTKQYHQKSPQYEQILKKNEQMYALLAICLSLCPQVKLVDETVNSQLREKNGEKMLRMQRYDEDAFATYDELFSYACPKFITPSAPSFEEPLVNYNQDAYRLQLKLFLYEVKQQQSLASVRTYLKVYSTISLAKLASYVEVDEPTLRTILLTYKHKTHAVDSDGKIISNADVDFYIDDDMIYVTEAKPAKRYGDYFLRQVVKLEGVIADIDRIKLEVINIMLNLMGVAMIIYSLWFLKKWKLGDKAALASALPTPWFIYACLVVGIIVCSITVIGHMTANSVSDYTLAIFLVSICCLLLIQAVIIVTVFFKIDWNLRVSRYIDEHHKEFKSFVLFHVSVCRTISIMVFVAQVGVASLAATLLAVGCEPTICLNNNNNNGHINNNPKFVSSFLEDSSSFLEGHPRLPPPERAKFKPHNPSQYHYPAIIMTKSNPGVITCKAAVVWKSGEPPKVETIQVDPPKASEVRIKMLCASLCHTDVLCCNGLPVPLFPRIPGHEGVGMVESVGEGVTTLKEGDIVMPLYLGECGECLNCKSGKTNLCHKYPLGFSGLLLDGTSRMSIAGQTVYHHFSCSTWSEYIVIEAPYAVKVDPRVSLPHASFLCCGFTTGFGAAWREVIIPKGATVAVLGLGAVGLGVVEGARVQGASRIIGVDINDLKEEKGKAFGMTEFINPKKSDKSISELIKDVTGGLGVDFCFECTGVPALLNEAIDASKVGLGTIVLIGAGLEPSGVINYIPLLCGRVLKGSIYGGVRPLSDLPTIVDKCINKEIPLDELMTHEVTLDEINKGFEYLKHPDCVKVVIKF